MISLRPKYAIMLFYYYKINYTKLAATFSDPDKDYIC